MGHAGSRVSVHVVRRTGAPLPGHGLADGDGLVGRGKIIVLDDDVGKRRNRVRRIPHDVRRVLDDRCGRSGCVPSATGEGREGEQTDEQSIAHGGYVGEGLQHRCGPGERDPLSQTNPDARVRVPAGSCRGEAEQAHLYLQTGSPSPAPASTGLTVAIATAQTIPGKCGCVTVADQYDVELPISVIPRPLVDENVASSLSCPYRFESA